MRTTLCRQVSMVTLLLLLAGSGCVDRVREISFGERTLDVSPLRYELDLDVDYEEERLSGAARITVRNHSDDPVDHVPLLLYRLMHVDSVADSEGDPLKFTQRVLAFEDWGQLQASYVEVELPASLAPGERTLLTVEWSGHLLGYAETGMLYVRDSIDRDFTILRPDSMAYPEIGYPHWGVNRGTRPADFDFRIRVTVPDDLVVANAGRLIGSESENGRTIFEFESIQPSWRMDIAIAPYELLERDGLRIYHFAEDLAGAQTIAGEFLRAVKTFGEWFGPLPEFRGFIIIEIPSGFGSQTDVACIIQTADAFRDTTELNQLYHEASHLWNVPSTDLPAPRWEEGLASFLERLLVDLYAGDEDLTEVERTASSVRERLLAKFEQNPELAAVPMVEFGREGRTDLSYRVGMLQFAVLHRLVGQETFNRIVGGFFQRRHDDGASTDEFVAFADTTAEVDLQAFFREWMYTTEYRRHLGSELSLAEIADTYR